MDNSDRNICGKLVISSLSSRIAFVSFTPGLKLTRKSHAGPDWYYSGISQAIHFSLYFLSLIFGYIRPPIKFGWPLKFQTLHNRLLLTIYDISKFW